MDAGRVIAALRRELDQTPVHGRPFEYAVTSHRLAMALAERPDGDRPVNLREAIGHYADALAVFTDAFPLERGRVLVGLGAAERGLGMGSVARGRFEEATTLLRQVAGAEPDLAAALNNLGLTLGDLGLFGEAEEAFAEALAALGSPEHRRVRATTLHNLGLVHFAAGSIAAAARAQRQAVAEADLDDTAFVWASAQQALGVALLAMPEERAEWLREARSALGEALRVFRRNEFPFQHAVTMNNLGLAYLEEPDVDATGLRAALACFEDALSVFDPRLHRDLWGEARRNLENALSHLAAHDEVMEPEDHFARLAAARREVERERLVRDRWRRLLTLPEPPRDRLVGRLDRAFLHLDGDAVEELTLLWMRVLMEQPHQHVMAALRARVANLADLDGEVRHRAGRAIEKAIGDLEVIQRVRIRELLVGLGYERPEPA